MNALDIALLASLFPLFAIAYLAFYLYKRRYLGYLPVSTESVAYNREKYGHILNWDKYCLSINGNPTFIISGEFHYWRLPDRDRWEEILLKYRMTGLNCIRIYFHWGFHSPDEGIYQFDGNKDVEYLLKLCQKLRLFVMAAPGPYICAETQGGGIPYWLIAKRDVRIRHSNGTIKRQYDPKYSFYCYQWFLHILSILKKYQITENNDGCVIALQIENESSENLGILPIGVHDDMRHLCKSARDLGMTVPFFTNDAYESGSFNPTSKSSKTFGIDLYGFDKYAIFAPISHPVYNLMGSEKYKDKENWKEWATPDFESAVDNIEKKVRSFGGGAAKSPILIPELQGGWFNHYDLKHTYDDIYRYYGEEYTRIIFDSVMAQGSTILSYYMFYGGTNWGTLGDPDVYTSYDYSACIREYGFLCGRARKLRLGVSFIRSFSDTFVKTEFDPRPKITVSPSKFLNRVRQSVVKTFNDESTTFVFLRNFSATKQKSYNLTLNIPNTGSVTLTGTLPYKSSMIALGNYTTSSGMHLLFSTIPIHIKTCIDDQEIWIVQSDDMVNGQMAFKNHLIAEGNLDMDIRLEGLKINVLSWRKPKGWMCIKDIATNKKLFIVSVSGHDLYTLSPTWEEQWFTDGIASSPVFVTWGVQNAIYEDVTKSLKIGVSKDDRSLYVLAKAAPNDQFGVVGDGEYEGCPFIFVRNVTSSLSSPEDYVISFPKLRDWKIRDCDWNRFPWIPLPLQSGSCIKPALDVNDLGFSSGHALYKIRFTATSKSPSPINFDVNMRHRATFFFNDVAIGGHMTYSLFALRPGAKFGPDSVQKGMKRYILPSHLVREGVNEIIAVIENFGLNRQAFFFDDVRNPRGILEARLCRAETTISNIECFISGVDIRKTNDVFSSSGFVDEGMNHGWSDLDVQSNEGSIIPIEKTRPPQWFTAKFDFNIDKVLDIPLRLHFEGSPTVFFWLNDILIGRYYGNGDGPQKDFYLMSRLIKPFDNELKFLCYDGRVSDDKSDALLKIEIRGWNMNESDLMEKWSGNMCEDGSPYIVRNHEIPIHI